MDVRFDFITLLSSMTQAEEARAVVESYEEVLVDLGGEKRDEATWESRRPLVFLVGTGGTEHRALALWEERCRLVGREALIVISHPAQNSLPAAMEVVAYVQQKGAMGRVLHLRGADDANGINSVREAISDLDVAAALHRVRLGVVGEPAPWLVASTPPPASVKSMWGPTLESIAPQEVLEAYERAEPGAAEATVSAMRDGASGPACVTKASLEKAARLHDALRAVIRRHNLTAVAVSCFPFIDLLDTTACLALAELNDAGIVAACEGDVVSGLGMLWAQKLLGRTPWMANPATLDEQENTIRLAHCTVARSWVKSYMLRSHFESDRGVAIQGEIGLGPVTVLRIGGEHLDQLWLAEGEILSSPALEGVCRTQAVVKLTRGSVSDLLRRPLGNHLVLVSGHHAERMRAWWKLMVEPRARK